MSNTYKNIKDYAFSAHTESFKVLKKVFATFSIRYFLIGAQARDIHFFQKGIKPTRGTRDIDFAVMVESMEQYECLKETLQSQGFRATADPYRLNWAKGDTVIDLLPFGQVEEGYTVNFDERNVELSVLGYKELNDELDELYLDEDSSVSIPVPPLHGIFILKLLSWNEKPEREWDLSDLSQILSHYWEFVEDEAYDKHLDLFDDEDFTMEKAAARILGRHLKTTLNKSMVLKQVVMRILEAQSAQVDPPGPLLQKFAREKNKPVEEVQHLLEEIMKGINDSD